MLTIIVLSGIFCFSPEKDLQRFFPIDSVPMTLLQK